MENEVVILSPVTVDEVQLFILDMLPWIKDHALDKMNLLQVGISAFLLSLAWLASPFFRGLLAKFAVGHESVGPWLERSQQLVAPTLWLLFVWIVTIGFDTLDYDTKILRVVASLLLAWVAIRFASFFLRDRVLAKLFSFMAWAVAALNILGWLDGAILFLDKLGFNAGDVRISALTVLKAMITITLFMWVAIMLSRVMERRLKTLPSLTPSVQVLLIKIFKIAFIAAALLAGVSAVGIDLTAFAFFTGALGIGIGFGLQTIISNLVSGVILLLDRSVKPGDVIKIGDTYGWIDSLNARYITIVTRDGTEHLIPNEKWITEPVENWSHSNTLHRIKLPIGVAYNSDLEKVIEICIEAAASVPRVLDRPEVNCLITDFGDSAILLEVRIWILDPQNGRANVKSQAYLAVWKALKEAGVEIPFPQRDLHIQSVSKNAARILGAKASS